MGGGSWTNRSWSAYAADTSVKSTEQIFKQRTVHPDLDPYKINYRESLDSADSPEATPIAIFVDVTGSMGYIAEAIVKEQCGRLMHGILERSPVSNPQVMFGAIGDAACDNAPLQVSQFEADIRIVQQLEKVYLEGRGGGNDSESYTLPWYFAARHTTHDAYNKRGKRGYLFTMGDELPPEYLPPRQVEKVLGYAPMETYSVKQLFDIASERYHVFHLIIAEGDYCRRHRDHVIQTWQGAIGQHAIVVEDHKQIPDIILQTINMCEQG